MKLRKIFVCLSLITVFGLTACNNSDSPPTDAAPPTPTEVSLLTESESTPESEIEVEKVEVEVKTTPTPTATATATPEPTATNTRVKTTPTPPAPSPTPEPEPIVKIDETLTAKINIRSGPGTEYPVVTQFEPGREAPALGRIADLSWWQIDLPDETDGVDAVGWVFAELAVFSGNREALPLAEIPPLPPTPTPEPALEAEVVDVEVVNEAPVSGEELADELRCGQDFCVTYQAMVPIWENGGCVGNHSIYITVLEGPPPGRPIDGIVIGDTFNNVEVGSGSHGPGRTEITLWNNSMTLVAKRHMDGTPYTSEESFNFTAADELIPAEVLAANGYCEGRIDVCEYARNHNSVCRGHYSWRVTFHKFD